MKAEQKARKQEQGDREGMRWIEKGNNLWKREKPPYLSAMCLNFQALAGARLAQSVERKALNLMVVRAPRWVLLLSQLRVSGV